MKKKFLLFGVIALMSGTFLTSCGEDVCTCTEEGYGGSREVDPASYDAKTCSDLELKLSSGAGSAGYEQSYFSCQ